MSAMEAIQWIASCAARSAQPLPPSFQRSAWPEGFRTSYEVQGLRPTIPLAVIARYFHRLLAWARRGRKLEHISSPAPAARAKAIAERPAFLACHGDDPAIVWTGGNEFVECDWIPEADEWAREAPVLARLWGALHGCVPVQMVFRCPANGDYARVALRPALPGEDPGPREPFVSRGR